MSHRAIHGDYFHLWKLKSKKGTFQKGQIKNATVIKHVIALSFSYHSQINELLMECCNKWHKPNSLTHPSGLVNQLTNPIM